MKLLDPRRAAFSPYGLAAIGRAVGLILGLAALLAMGSGRVSGGILIWFLTLIVILVAEENSRCPSCDKNPIDRARDDNEGIVELLFVRRWHLWPERECSECGYDLTETAFRS